jgi:hypothetical protein
MAKKKFYLSRVEHYRLCVEANSAEEAEELMSGGELDWTGATLVNGMESVVGEAPADAVVDVPSDDED